MTSVRKSVSFRIDHLEDSEQAIINDWLNAQKNIQTSLPMLLLHMANMLGKRDIMGYEVQRILHAQSFGINTLVAATPVVEATPTESNPDVIMSQVIDDNIPKEIVVELNPQEEVKLNQSNVPVDPSLYDQFND